MESRICLRTPWQIVRVELVMQVGDIVLIDGRTEVEIIWLGNYIAGVKCVEKGGYYSVTKSRLSRKHVVGLIKRAIEENAATWKELAKR